MSVDRFLALSDDQLDAIDAACSRLEDSWKQGRPVSIEHLCENSEPGLREYLLRELVASEIEQRRARGEQPQADEYFSRFANETQAIGHAFELTCDGAPAATSDVKVDQTLTVAFDATSQSIRRKPLAGSTQQPDSTGQTNRSTAADDASDFSQSEPFGRYLLLRLLGKGGMGSVYLAHDQELDRRVAIKFPEFDDRPDVATVAIERFRREARSMATLQHPNICPIFDVGQHAGRHFLTMAYVDGRNLSDAARSLTPEASIQILAKVAHALAAAHDAGVVHRDLKPSNVMLNARGEPIVMDFGLASRDSVSESIITHSGLIIGSPAYMAPEQVEAAHDKVGPRTDVYALGVILYQLLAGCRPFEGAGLSVLGQISSGKKPPPPSQIRNIDPRLDTICLRAMAHRIEDRYQSAEALAEALEEWMQIRGITSATPRGTAGRTRWIAVGTCLFFGSLLVAFAIRPDASSQLHTSLLENPDTPAVATVTAVEHSPATPPLKNVPLPALLTAPFDEQQAKKRQQDWAEYLDQPIRQIVRLPGGGTMKMVLIPAGEFLMGSDDEQLDRALRDARDLQAANPARPDPGVIRRIEQNEHPQHNVVITTPFRMSETEVTIGQFRKFSASGYLTEAELAASFDTTDDSKEQGAPTKQVQTFLAPGFPINDDHPASSITWNDATAFCRWLSDEGNTTYRLPTEAEWEYACRAGTTTQYYFGDDYHDLAGYCWYNRNTGTPHPVGQLLPNNFGLFEMHGNMWEWCSDYWNEHYYQESSLSDPTGPANGLQRVVRGGTFAYNASNARSASRGFNAPSTRYYGFGFRVVAELETESQTVAGTAIAESLVSSKSGMLTQSDTLPAAIPVHEVQVKALQRDWSDRLGLPIENEIELPGGASLTMVLIPPGEFLMGSSKEQQAQFMEAARASDDSFALSHIPGEGPQHRVRITKPFYMGKYEVTQAQWQSVMGRNPARFTGSLTQPVEQVSWDDIQPFLATLNESESVPKMTLVLPTEAQWEYACRAGTTGSHYDGESEAVLLKYGWFLANSGGRTHSVGELKPNAFGLYDIHGNVWEWCTDWYAADYYANSPVDDPSGPATGLRHVYRGACWSDRPGISRTGVRNDYEPGAHFVGFRLAALLAPETLDAFAVSRRKTE